MGWQPCTVKTVLVKSVTNFVEFDGYSRNMKMMF